MKKTIIITVVVIILFLTIPSASHLKDGGTVEYNALIYNVTKVKRLNSDSKTGYDEGIIIKLFGNIIYNNVEINVLENNLELEDVVNEDGLLFSISRNDKKCIPLNLNVYKDGKYEIYTAYEACKPSENCNSILRYTDKENGKYDFDVIKILRYSKASSTSDTSNYPPMYEMYLGNSERYITGSNNSYLEEFLKSINVDLNKCAKKDYKS